MAAINTPTESLKEPGDWTQDLYIFFVILK